MLDAFLERDASYDGVFVTGVTTTGIFCRPTCPARKPKPDNVEFFPAPRDALLAGYRPCLRCRPMRDAGEPPPWLDGLLERVEADPSRRWTDDDLRSLDLSPSRVRRWFKRHHGMTFHAYSRARRLGSALGMLQDGEPVTRTAFDSGFDSLSAFNDAFRRVLGETPTDARRRTVVRLARFATPLGPMLAGGTDDALVLLEFVDRRMLETQLVRLRDRLDCLFVPGGGDVLAAAEGEMEAYFRGELTDFTVPLRTPGTDFQREVWDALREVPYGTTVSYGELARRLGRPGAARAVARANGDNRLAVMIPCHRVVGSDGSLTGYGGGLWRKRRLLELEGRTAGTG
ncbi:MAG: trifunctional transcriptional activator/DNA repair protein Ada/methylated-DNA--[protein]-cysteine S-methyltransferase [Gemmatimonadota bacterium]|jgi:AraC family transcriptional regulator of adaptative response/methylated-DNA-[protein]-cysteine methyltransferase